MLHRATSASNRQTVHTVHSMRKAASQSKNEVKELSDKKKKEDETEGDERSETKKQPTRHSNAGIESNATSQAEHAQRLQNIFHGSSKNEQAAEGGNGATQRTAGTTDTTQKTCDESANNSNSIKISAGNLVTVPPNNRRSDIAPKPPKDTAPSNTNHHRNRPQTSGPASQVAWRFYHYQNNDKRQGGPSASSVGDSAEVQAYGRTTTSSSSNVFNIVGQKNHGPQQDKHGIMSLSVERNSLKYTRASGQQHRSQNSYHQQSSGPSGYGHLDHYQIGKPIGQGAYAVVYICYHKASMKKYAIKIYQKAKLNDSMKRKAVQREIMALKRIDHPNIIRMHDLIETSK